MPRFRFDDPQSAKGRYRVLSQFVKFMLGWNLIAYATWRHMSQKQTQKDPEFDSMPTARKILVLMGKRQDQIITVNPGDSLKERLEEHKPASKQE